MIKRFVPALLVAVVIVLAAFAASGPPVADGHQETSVANNQEAPQPGPRPNFVFILTDDLSGNIISHLPHVRALARAGASMSRYYVVDSLCCPSRAAIFTGQYPHDNGVFTNKGADGGYDAYNRNGDQQKSFAVALQNAGYQTALMGKYLNGYEPGYGVAPGWDEWDAVGNGYPEFNYFMNTNGRERFYGGTARSYLTDVLSEKGSEFIDSASASGQPFMLEIATFAPHAPYTPARRYADAARKVAYPKSSAWNRLPKNPPSWLKGHPRLTRDQRQEITAAYRRRIESALSVDQMVGRLQAELRATGEAGNTYLVFSSDNGYHMGEYRLLPGKQTAFDTDIHVPLIVSGPGVPAGKVISQLASNIDLNPTFEALAGLPVPAGADGHSLAALWHGQNPARWRQAILIEHHGPDDSAGDPDRQNKASGDPPSYEAIRTATALYVRYASGEQEYYNTVRDPLELDNIASSGVPAALRTALAALANCHGGASCWAAAHLPR